MSRRIQYQPGVRFIHRHTPLARSSREYNQLSARNIFLLYAMNWPLPLGPLYGFAKAVSLILKTRDDLWVCLAGPVFGCEHGHAEPARPHGAFLEPASCVSAALPGRGRT